MLRTIPDLIAYTFDLIRNPPPPPPKKNDADSIIQMHPDHTRRVKPQLHCHDFGHDGATTHPDLSSRDASA